MSNETSTKRVWISLVVPVVAAAATMLPVLWAQYTGWSDMDFIDRSPFWRHGILESIGLILAGKAYPTNANYAVPQTFSLFDVLVFHRNPHLSHLLNYLLHLVNVALVWQCIRRLLTRSLSSRLSDGQIVLAAGIGATLFGVHPLSVEPVAWISGREIELTLLFWMSAFLLLLSSRGGWMRYALAVAVYVLSAFSNGLSYGLPLVFGAWWVIVERVPFRKAFYLALPFLAIAAWAATMRFSKETPERRLAVQTEKWSETLGDAFSARARETFALAYPKGLAPFYPWNRGPAWTTASFAGVFLMAASAFLIVWGWVRGTPLQRILAFGLAWYWLAVAIAFAHHHPRADRHTYCSAIGLFMAVGVLLALALERLRSSRRATPWRAALLAACCAAGLTLSVVAARQAMNWRTHKRLWQHALAVTNYNHVAHESLAFALAEEKDFDGAIAHYRAALDLFPDLGDTHYKLGHALMEKGRTEEAFKHFRLGLIHAPEDPRASGAMAAALLKLGRLDEAESLFRQAIRLDPDDADAHMNLGAILRERGEFDRSAAESAKAIEIKRAYPEAEVNLGAVLADQGRWQEAIAHYETALRAKPHPPEAEYNLGVALAALGRRDEALAHYEAALRIKPDYPDAENGLGSLLLDLGRAAEAAGHFERALRLVPGFGEAENGLGSALNMMGRREEARSHYETSIRLDPNCVGARYNLANLLLEMGRPQEAAEHYEAALRIAPDSADILHRLGIALFQLDRMKDAIPRFDQAAQLDPNNPEIRCNLGAALASAGRLDEAIVQFKKSLELQPDYAPARAALEEASRQSASPTPSATPAVPEAAEPQHAAPR